LKFEIAIKKFNEKSYELETIDPKEIYTNKLNYFYFDYSMLKDLYILCQNNDQTSEKKNSINESNNNNNDLLLINHIFQNNINLFFSYIYNKFDNIFKNDFICSANISLRYFNLKIYDDLIENFYPFFGYDNNTSDYENDFNGDNDNIDNDDNNMDNNIYNNYDYDVSYYSDDNNEIYLDEFQANLKEFYKPNYKLNFFLYRMEYFKYLNESNENIKNYETFFKNLSIFIKYYCKIISQSPEIEYNNIKHDVIYRPLSIYCIQDSISFEYKEEYSIENYNIIKSLDDFINNFDYMGKLNKLIKNRKLKDTKENIIFNKKIYVLYKLFKKNNIYTDDEETFLFPKTRRLFYERYTSSFIRKTNISQFNNYSFNSYEDFIFPLIKYFIKGLHDIDKNNEILTLNINCKYANDYIKFQESIIKLFDNDVKYKYKNLKLYNKNNEGNVIDLNPIYSSYFNVKLTNNEWFSINNNNKHFFLLTLSIYLLNADYSCNYLLNSLNNFNYCQYNDMAKENEINIVRWLKWNNFVTFTCKTKNEREIIKNTEILDNTGLSLKDFYNFDSYTNINRMLLPSFFYYLNENNIYNTYKIKIDE